MTAGALASQLNNAGTAQVVSRAALRVVRPSSGADLAAAEQAASAFLIALGVAAIYFARL